MTLYLNILLIYDSESDTDAIFDLFSECLDIRKTIDDIRSRTIIFRFTKMFQELRR